MKFVMSSAAKAELGALYTTAMEMVPPCQTLIKMGWLQPCTPIQTDKSTAVVKPSPWTSGCGGSAAENLNDSSATTGISQSQLGRLPHQAPPTHLPQSQQTHPCQCSSPTTLNCCPNQAPLCFSTTKTTSTSVFFPLSPNKTWDVTARVYCLPTTYVWYAHSQSLLLCSSLPCYSKSVYSVTWVQVDLCSYGTQLKPSSNDARF
jgi:hypothetical protein